MATAVLLAFGLSSAIVESCQKAVAQNQNPSIPPATTTTIGGVIVGAGLQVDNAGRISTSPSNIVPVGKLVYMRNDRVSGNDTKTIWVTDYDGTPLPGGGPVVLSPALPGTFTIRDGGLTLSPDGLYIFFSVKDASNVAKIYRCDVNGANAHPIANGTPGTTTDFYVGGAQ